MPGLFIFAIIVAVVAVLAIASFWLTWGERGKKNSRGELTDNALFHTVIGIAGGALVAFTALLMAVSSYTPVGTRDIGVVTSFGRTSGHLAPGINWIAPWEKSTTIDDSYQLTDETFTVKIEGGQTAQATVQVRWNAVDASADDIFANYKTTQGVENGLLIPELNVAANTVLDGYDPLTPLSTGAAAGSPTNPTTAQLGQEIQTALVKRVGGDISIKTLALKPLAYDSTVQARINSVTNQVAKTDVAKQSELTAQAQAAANKDLASNLVGNPLVLVQQCISGLNDGDITPVAGFSCWPGSNSGIVIPSSGS